jgi:hypothetical protein
VFFCIFLFSSFIFTPRFFALDECIYQLKAAAVPGAVFPIPKTPAVQAPFTRRFAMQARTPFQAAEWEGPNRSFTGIPLRPFSGILPVSAGGFSGAVGSPFSGLPPQKGLSTRLLPSIIEYLKENIKDFVYNTRRPFPAKEAK